MIFAVLEDLARVTADTTDEQLKLPTPSGDFTVADVRRHLTGGLTYFEAAFRDPDADDRGEDPHAYTGPDNLPAVIPQLSVTLRSALENGMGGREVKVLELGGVFPGAMVVDLLLIEAFTHGWDLARALDRPWEPDPAISEHTLAVFQNVIRPEFRGPGMAFAEEFPVGPQASAVERAVAFAGRDPYWETPVQG
ncbi:TIGR03086 family metal-binding protein [Kineosporia rhizophila]|uniref:TIGR03086 family metal-binding protein n=1 Tax=Kineosporia rhizophila TaxID=84633 RepID=UPI001E63F233|nr:TIGR03086 family metal-binding protein [Kineosporia rhizophila]MCE0535328.1 TIGR03086 family metal-binding protein [Kineosporia rhizophila]